MDHVTLGDLYAYWRAMEQALADGLVRAIGVSNFYPDRLVDLIELRWLIQRGVVAIPKTAHAERMAENFDVFDFALSEEEMAQVDSLDRGETAFLDHHDITWVRRLGNARVG